MAYSWNTGTSIQKPPIKKTTTTPTTTFPVPTPTSSSTTSNSAPSTAKVPAPPTTPAQGYLGMMNNVNTSGWQSLNGGIQVPKPPAAGAVTGALPVTNSAPSTPSTPTVPAPPQNTTSSGSSVKPWIPYVDNGITGAANQMVRSKFGNVEDNVVPAPPQPSTSTDNSYALSQAQIEAEAKARIDRLTADKERIANQTKASLLTSYNRLRDSVNQDRSLQDVNDQRSLSPFSGHSDYAQGMKVLTREKQDTQYADNYQTQVGNVDAQLNDWLNLAPEQQQQITDELTRLERDYGLQVGQLTGNFNGSRTLAGAAQDANYTGQYNGQQTLQAQNQAFAQSMDLANLTGTYNGQQTLAAKNQDWQNRFNYGQATGTFNNGQTTLQKQQADTQNAQWEQKFNEDARQFGLQYALQNWQAQQSAANAAADNARQNTALGLQQQQLDWSKDAKNPDNQYKSMQVQNNSPQAQMLEKAVSLAQKDPDYTKYGATEDDKRKIINYYMNLVNPTGTGSAGVSDSDIAQYLK